MSRYELQQCLFDHLRALERPDEDRAPDDIDTTGFTLTEAEAAACAAGDVGAFHTLGVHPVIINAYARANGWKRADYRGLFPAGAATHRRRARWQTS